MVKLCFRFVANLIVLETMARTYPASLSFSMLSPKQFEISTIANQEELEELGVGGRVPWQTLKSGPWRKPDLKTSLENPES